MSTEAKWEAVYSTRAPEDVSWFRPHLETSLALIERVATDHSAKIIDVGGGESTLVDDLLVRGYQNLTVLDISKTALEVTKTRLNVRAQRVHWLAADITQVALPPLSYDVWHDRAVFHFLTAQEDRHAYVESAGSSLKPGGHIIISAFGPAGPKKCSGLDVVRYNARTLNVEFGNSFRLVESLAESHITPTGNRQQFTYCVFQRC